MEHALEKNETGTTLTLSGDLSLPHAAKLKEALLEALAEGRDVIVRFRQVKEIDLSPLQLLCSAHRTAAESGFEFMLDIEEKGLFQRFKTAAGFIRSKGCRPGTTRSCLWLDQEQPAL